jgi:hypothetical protein
MAAWSLPGVVAFVLSSSVANAGLRQFYWDADVVGRSELIAVGHLKPESIEYVPHTNNPAFGRSWEHHATLVISAVVNGHFDTNEIPIIIHYGLDPVVGGHEEHEGFGIDRRGGRTDYPTNRIEIIDTGNSIRGGGSLVEDASKDNVWFLRRRTGIYGQDPGTGNLGIVDPEDLQPLDLKEYFELYLNNHPEDALKAYAANHPKVAPRIQHWLDHLATTTDWEAVKVIQDPQAKARKMASYLRPATAPKGAGELDRALRQEMPKLGADAVPALIEVLRAGMTNREDLNRAVLILYDIGKPAQPAVPVLCELLQEPGKTSRYYICSALKTAQDPKAIPFVRPMLESEDMQTATEAAEALAAMGDTESFDAIAALLPHLKAIKTSMDELHMHDLLKVLHHLDRQRAAPIVKRYMEDPAWAEMRDFLNPGN